jgi:hypothetical protein
LEEKDSQTGKGNCMRLIERSFRQLVVAAIVSLLAFGTGCVSCYNTSSVPNNQLASIVGEVHGSFWTVKRAIYICAVDGKTTSYWGLSEHNTIKVAAGLRKITVFYSSYTESVSTSGEAATITLPVEAGHTYIAKYEIGKDWHSHATPSGQVANSSIRYCIEDKDTGKVFNDVVYGADKMPKQGKD